jgi:hypothetical protein
VSCEAGLFTRSRVSRERQRREADRQFSNHWFFCAAPDFSDVSEGAIRT